MLTVCSGKGKEAHAFILSRTESSMILQTGQEINELESSGFYNPSPNVFSGNLGSNQFIMQVTPYSVLMLADSELVQTVPLDLGLTLLHHGQLSTQDQDRRTGHLPPSVSPDQQFLRFEGRG